MRPTGKLHLGHLVGALNNWAALQDEYDCFYFVADWHALTSDYADTSAIVESAYDMVADWIAGGLDPERSTLFVQSLVPEHAELFLLLSMTVPIPWLERVPTYKEQMEQLTREGSVDARVPRLSAAADGRRHHLQRATTCRSARTRCAHLELSREIVRRFHNFFGELFVEPQPLLTKFARLPGLDNRKMSKSYGNTINLSDDAETVRKKVMQMYTDPKRVRADIPGTVEGNPVFIYHDAFNPDTAEVDDLKTRYRAGKVGDVEVKTKLADGAERAISSRCARGARTSWRSRRRLREILHEGSRKARGDRPGDDGARPRAREAEVSVTRPSMEHPRNSNRSSRPIPVRLANFEGPLDLLLHLIKRHEVNIYDIPITLITKQYLEYIDLMQEMNLDVAGEFLVMAATLIHIKSRMLLPRPDPTQEDPEEDPREALMRRLLEHQKFKAAAELLHERETLRSAQWTRPDGPIAEIAGEAPEPEIEVDLFSLISAFRIGRRARQAAPEGLPAGRADSDRGPDRAAAGAAVGDRGLRVRGSVRRRAVPRRHDRHVPGDARDDPAEAGPRVPGGRGRADPRLQARAAGRRAEAAGDPEQRHAEEVARAAASAVAANATAMKLASRGTTRPTWTNHQTIESMSDHLKPIVEALIFASPEP